MCPPFAYQAIETMDSKKLKVPQESPEEKAAAGGSSMESLSSKKGYLTVLTTSQTSRRTDWSRITMVSDG